MVCVTYLLVLPMSDRLQGVCDSGMEVTSPIEHCHAFKKLFILPVND
jgi:hypothetical protein